MSEYSDDAAELPVFQTNAASVRAWWPALTAMCVSMRAAKGHSRSMNATTNSYLNYALWTLGLVCVAGVGIAVWVS